MKSKLLKLLCLLSALPALAQAQSCGSGGGVTLCLTAVSNPSSVQLNWTANGPVKSLEIYRDTDPDPTGRSRIAIPAAAATSYTDATAEDGKRYWYWVRFTTNAGSYNSGAAEAMRSSACPPTVITPYVKVNGSLTQTASATAAPGSAVSFNPQPLTGGSWAWMGCGTSGSAREQHITASASCTATAVYTNPCGGKSLQAFALSVPGVMRDITSINLTKEMVPGINLGNTLEAPSETAWVSVLTSQRTMDGYKAAGFKSVRIPVTWAVTHSDADLNIDPMWLARVKQVVDYARKAGLYVVLNNHWDQALQQPTYANQAANDARLQKYWTQIANYFKDYDDHLLFAGMNEVGMENSGWPTDEWAAVFNSYNQTFVNTVRATGGNNAKRHLVVQGYFTDINRAVVVNPMPTDTVANRLIMEVHYYDPYDFTLNGGSAVWQWGAGATDPNAVETWANEPWVDGQFQKMKTTYLDKGYGVIIGEYGAYVKSQFPGMATYRNAWASYVTHSIVQHGLVPMWWDTGELIDRATGAIKFPDTVNAIINAAK